MNNSLGFQEISEEVLEEKYSKKNENGLKENRTEIQKRVAKALSEQEKDKEYWASRFFYAQESGFIPAGRINSAAGTDIAATLINCFVQPIGDSISEDIGDSPSIYKALAQSAETMRRGGGVGYNFSNIRPINSKVKGTGSMASGPLSYMKVFDISCETVESAGSRRGAQMGMLNIEHPDILSFIHAKDSGELKNFNLSVAVSDKFMNTLKEGGLWELVHKVEPSDKIKTKKTYQRDDGLWIYQIIPAKEIWDHIMKSTYDHAEPGVIFIDTANKENNLQYCEVFEATNPCAEEFLPPYGCCCLGSINLTKFIENPFLDNASFNFEKFKEIIFISIRMLDNVLNVTHWPLKEHETEAMNKRRIGLGYTGLGDALIMLKLKYDSKQAQDMASLITKELAISSYKSSIDLAKEKGSFLLFDADNFLKEGTFASTLPEDLKGYIKEFGLRNSHLNAIAPTGTISLAFADNASNGIEPPFSYVYNRKKRMPDGSLKEYVVEDYAYRLFKHINKIDKVESLPSYFTTALEIDVAGHLDMMLAVKPYIDTSISKTVNIPEEYPYESFKDLYLQAWNGGLKGLATYRPNKTLGSVLSVKDESKTNTVESFDQTEKDRRIVMKEVVVPALSSLKWPSRPETPNGNTSWTYMVKHKFGKFAIIIGHLDIKNALPFELWITGSNVPRCLEAIAKTLSSDLRTQDISWINLKLNSLLDIYDEDNFYLTLPKEKKEVFMPSTVSALSRILQYRIEELDVKNQHKSHMVSMLFSKKKPKTGVSGTMSWSVDVQNHQVGDDFTLHIKEIILPNNETRPYAIELSGKYPKSLDGLVELLSFDMRVLDVSWIVMKLKSLLTYAEPRGDFMAFNPITGKQENWPSTVAHMAHLILYRYKTLGLLKEDNDVTQKVGKKCNECGEFSLIKKDGCEFCTSCGYVGSCG